MTAPKARPGRLILFLFAVLALCFLLAGGAFAADPMDLSNPQLVVFDLGPDGAFSAEEDNYILFSDDVIVLRETDGFSLSGLDGVQTVAGEEFPRYQVSGPALPGALSAGKTVCFVASDMTVSSGLGLMTVQEVRGNSFTAYAGPPEEDLDGGSLSKKIMKWVYKQLKGIKYEGEGSIKSFEREFNFAEMVSLKAVFDATLGIRIGKQDENGPLMISYDFGFGISSLEGTLDSKGGQNITIAFDVVEIPIVGIPKLGLELSIGPEITLSGSGQVRAHMTPSRKTVQYRIYSNGSTETDKSSDDGAFELDYVQGTLDCYFGISTGLDFKVVVISTGFSTGTGYHFKVGVCGNDGGNPEENQAAGSEVMTWHMCKTGTCLNGGASLSTGWGFSLKMDYWLFSVTLSGFDIPLAERGLWRFCYTGTYGEMIIRPDTSLDLRNFDPFFTESICPHKAWRLNVKAVHKDDHSKVVPYATIGLAKAPDYKGWKPTDAAVKKNSYFVTGSNGQGVLFIPKSSGTVIRGTDPVSNASGELAVSKQEMPESVIVEIDYEPLDVHFLPNTDAKVESMPESISAYPGDVISLKGPSGFPRAEGMDFAGWSEDPKARWDEPEKLVTEEQLTLDRSYTFYAVWKRYFTINFHNYDGSLLRTLRVPEFSSVAYSGARPTRPADEHYDYIFSGWEPVLETTALRDMSYTATYWGKCKTFYTVTWQDEDGNVYEKDEGVPYMTDPQYNGPTPQKHSTMDQYYFSGWDPVPAPVTDNITYTARFSSVPAEICIVTFEGEGGYLVPPPQQVPRGGRVAHPSDDPRRDGYEFAEWQLEGAPYDFSQPVLNSMTLRAAWDPVSYQFTGGAGQTWLNTAEYGPSFTVSRNLRDEKTFGLFEALYLDGEPLDGTHFTHEKGSLRLALLPDYAKTLTPGEHRIRTVFADGEAECAFTVKAGAYTITYDLAGGELPAGETNPEFYTTKDTFTLVNPVMDDHIFTGWTGTGLRGRSVRVTVPKGSSGNRNYTAHWAIQECRLVIFLDTVDDPASDLPEPIIFRPDPTARVVLPSGVPVKQGWRFLGWNTRENGSGAGYAPGSVLELKDSLVLYALWDMELPLTGDEGNPVLWGGLILLGIISLAAVSFPFLRRRK